MSIRENIYKKLETEFSLPPSLHITKKLSDIVKRPDTSITDIANVVQYDPALTSRFLRLANSVAFAGSTKVSSVEDAVLRIGFGNVSNIITTFSMIKSLPLQCQHVVINGFWKHSLSVAFTSEMIAQCSEKIQGPYDDYYISGLLHDIGILVLDILETEAYGLVMQEVEKVDKQLFTIETEMLGINHAEVGAAVLKKWNLPLPIVEGVKFHHNPCSPEQTVDSYLAKVVHLANFACNDQGIGNTATPFFGRFSEGAWDDIGLQVENIPQIIDYVTQRIDEVTAILEVATT